jgi:hypothetical protein
VMRKSRQTVRGTGRREGRRRAQTCRQLELGRASARLRSPPGAGPEADAAAHSAVRRG